MIDDYYFNDSEGPWPGVPNPGDLYDCITGVVSYSYSEFKIYPRNIHDFSCDGGLGISDNMGHPNGYHLDKPYPNPFNPSTTIGFTIPYRDFVSIQVYDINGGWVNTLVEDYFNPGTHRLTWDGTNHPSGKYFVKMKSGEYLKTQVITLIK